MEDNRFYICEHCGNIVGIVHDGGVPLVCWGQKMTKLEPGTVEASVGMHLPVVSVENGIITAKIGSVSHPMTEEHHISWIYLQTARGGPRKALNPNEKPEVTFALTDEKPIAVYAYCNLHGLWKTDI